MEKIEKLLPVVETQAERQKAKELFSSFGIASIADIEAINDFTTYDQLILLLLGWSFVTEDEQQIIREYQTVFHPNGPENLMWSNNDQLRYVPHVVWVVDLLLEIFAQFSESEGWRLQKGIGPSGWSITTIHKGEDYKISQKCVTWQEAVLKAFLTTKFISSIWTAEANQIE